MTFNQDKEVVWFKAVDNEISLWKRELEAREAKGTQTSLPRAQHGRFPGRCEQTLVLFKTVAYH